MLDITEKEPRLLLGLVCVRAGRHLAYDVLDLPLLSIGLEHIVHCAVHVLLLERSAQIFPMRLRAGKRDKPLHVDAPQYQGHFGVNRSCAFSATSALSRQCFLLQMSGEQAAIMNLLRSHDVVFLFKILENFVHSGQIRLSNRVRIKCLCDQTLHHTF
jgi:hypothetical protein